LNAWANPIRLSKLNDKIDKFFYGIVKPSAINTSAADLGIAISDGAPHTNEVLNKLESQPALLPSPSETIVPLRGVQMHSLSSKKVDVVVLSPPWGGPNYLEESAYDLSTMLTCGDGLKLVAAAASVAETIVYIVPRNTIDKQLTILANVLGCKYHIEDIYINNKCKVKVAYYGHFHR
jgi:hypothetical protein